MERNVVITYRRHMKRKGATPFTCYGSALREEIEFGAVLSPEFVERFSDGTRTYDERGNIVLTRKGKDVLLSTVETEEVLT